MSQTAPEPAPNVAQLLAFYLEAGVDCALGEEPVNRLADPDLAPAAPREAPPPAVARSMPAAPVLTGLAEAPPAPDAAIASAREAARTAPTLEALRDLLEKFDGCALKSTATRLVFAEMGCGSCHRLAAAGSNGPIGPSLDDALPRHTRASLLAKISDPGAGSLMPGDFARRMSPAQLQALVTFLLATRAGGGSR